MFEACPHTSPTMAVLHLAITVCPSVAIRQEAKEPLNVPKISKLLQQCGSTKDLSEGKRIHDQILQHGLERDRFLGNQLVQMYGKCGALQDARAVFDNICRKNIFSWNIMLSAYTHLGHINEAQEVFGKMDDKDLVSWNVMLAGYAEQGFLLKAIELFREMPSRDLISWNAMVNAYARHGELKKALTFFQQMPERDVFTWTTMVAGYALKGQLKEALELFEKMPVRNIVSWTALVVGFAQHGNLNGVQNLFMKMPPPDMVSWNAMIAAYARNGQLKGAVEIFEQMPSKDVVSWSAIISAYAQHGHGKHAVRLFLQMILEGVMPNSVTFDSILSACSHDGMANLGCHFFVSMSQVHHLTPALQHHNCIVDLLGRAGLLDCAETLMNNLPFQPDSTSWNAFITSCTLHASKHNGEHAPKHLLELEPEDAASYVMISTIYCSGENSPL